MPAFPLRLRAQSTTLRTPVNEFPDSFLTSRQLKRCTIVKPFKRCSMRLVLLLDRGPFAGRHVRTRQSVRRGATRNNDRTHPTVAGARGVAVSKAFRAVARIETLRQSTAVTTVKATCHR